MSLPRLRPCAGSFEPRHPFDDRDLVQVICALRVCFPQVGIVLSTREPAPLRDALLPLGITLMSAGSHTEPGGYTGAGREDLHLTVKGRAVSAGVLNPEEGATGQFEIADTRSPAQIAEMLRLRGFDPVWKDWDFAILATSEDERPRSTPRSTSRVGTGRMQKAEDRGRKTVLGECADDSSAVGIRR